MKESGTSNWLFPNTGADNSSGFAGLPGGTRQDDGIFSILSINGYWSGVPEFDTTFAWSRFLTWTSGSFTRAATNKRGGISVRCLRD
jgi:hypothetical protein